MHALTSCDKQLGLINNLKYLGSLITASESVEEEITSRITESKGNFPNR